MSGPKAPLLGRVLTLSLLNPSNPRTVFKCRPPGVFPPLLDRSSLTERVEAGWVPGLDNPTA
jgi:hypothetical protein